MSADVTNTVGIVLAGGQSRRMGGGDKGLRVLADKTMLRHVIDRLKPQVDAVALNANGAPERFADYGLPVFEDTIPDHAGPLAGVLAGMRWARKNAPNADAILTVPTDTPFLPTNLQQQFSLAREKSNKVIFLATSAAGHQPVIGLWPVDLADALETALDDGIRKVRAWTDMYGTQFVHFDPIVMGDQQLDPFLNANTPEEFADAETLLKKINGI